MRLYAAVMCPISNAMYRSSTYQSDPVTQGGERFAAPGRWKACVSLQSDVAILLHAFAGLSPERRRSR
ncbi:hypothetical protein B0H13DRAFT_2279602 [Mycena leptocephala]|nr:hypothetical protein B0H13DRAFT_2279602 [Mycena leptocephala]